MNRFSTHVTGFIVGIGEVCAIVLILACISVWAGIASGSL
jgi:hypothetical protein